MRKQCAVTPKIRMTSTKFFKRACTGAAFLAAISAASAVGFSGEAPSVWKAASERLQSVRWDMDNILAAASSPADPVWLALLGLAFMVVVVMRRRDT